MAVESPEEYKKYKKNLKDIKTELQADRIDAATALMLKNSIPEARYKLLADVLSDGDVNTTQAQKLLDNLNRAVSNKDRAFIDYSLALLQEYDPDKRSKLGTEFKADATPPPAPTKTQTNPPLEAKQTAPGNPPDAKKPETKRSSAKGPPAKSSPVKLPSVASLNEIEPKQVGSLIANFKGILSQPHSDVDLKRLLNDPDLNRHVLASLLLYLPRDQIQKLYPLLNDETRSRVTDLIYEYNGKDPRFKQLTFDFLAQADHKSQVQLLNKFAERGFFERIYETDNDKRRHAEGQRLFRSLGLPNQISLLTKAGLNKEVKISLFQALGTKNKIAVLINNDVPDSQKIELFKSLNANQKTGVMVQGFKNIEMLKTAAKNTSGDEKNKLNIEVQKQTAILKDLFTKSKLTLEEKQRILFNQSLSAASLGELFLVLSPAEKIEFINSLIKIRPELRELFFARMNPADVAKVLAELASKEESFQLAKDIFAKQQAKQQADVIRNLLAKQQQNVADEQKQKEQEKAKLEKEKLEKEKLAGDLLDQKNVTNDQREKIFQEFDVEEAAAAFKAMGRYSTKFHLLAKAKLDVNDEINALKKQAMFDTLFHNQQKMVLSDKELSNALAADFFINSLENQKTGIKREDYDSEGSYQQAVFDKKFNYALSILKSRDMSIERARALFNRIDDTALQTELLSALPPKLALDLFKGIPASEKNAANEKQVDILEKMTNDALDFAPESAEGQYLFERTLSFFKVASAKTQAATLEKVYDTYSAKNDQLNNRLAALNSRIAALKGEGKDPDADQEVQRLREEVQKLQNQVAILKHYYEDLFKGLNHQQQAQVLKEALARYPDNPHKNMPMCHALLSSLSNDEMANVLAQGALKTNRSELFLNAPEDLKIRILMGLSTNRQGMANGLFKSCPLDVKIRLLEKLLTNDPFLGNPALAEKLFKSLSYKDQKAILMSGDLKSGHVQLFNAMESRWEIGNRQEKLLSDPELAKKPDLQQTLLNDLSEEQREKFLSNPAVINNIAEDDRYKYIQNLNADTTAKLFNAGTKHIGTELKNRNSLFQQLAAEQPDKAVAVLNQSGRLGHGKQLLGALGKEDPQAAADLLLNKDLKDQSKYLRSLKNDAESPNAIEIAKAVLKNPKVNDDQFASIYKQLPDATKMALKTDDQISIRLHSSNVADKVGNGKITSISFRHAAKKPPEEEGMELQNLSAAHGHALVRANV